MVINRVLNYEEFEKLEESRSDGKKQYGVLGPFADGSMKLKVSPNHSDGLIVYSIAEDSINLQNGERTLTIPASSCDFEDKDGYSTINVKPYTKWFSNDENKEDLHDFIEVFIDSKVKSPANKTQSISDDVEMLIDLFGIPGSATKCTEITGNHYDVDLDNGMQIEVKKRDSDDFFKTVKIFKDNKSALPACKLKRNANDKILDFKTSRGEFSERADSIKDLLMHPVVKYLLGVCLGLKDEDGESILMDHYQKLLKHHEFKVESAKHFNQEKHEREKEEIMRIKRILSNTVDESILDSLYNNYRARK